MVKSLNTIKDMIDQYVKMLESCIAVDTIILFGSYSRGTALEDSDIDLIVISDGFTEMPFLKRLEMLELLWPFTDAVEAIGYTKSEYEQYSNELRIASVARKEGKEIYRKAA